MTVKQKLALAKLKAKEANRKADPVLDSWITRITKRLTDSPYTGPIILALVVCGVVAAWVLL